MVLELNTFVYRTLSKLSYKVFDKKPPAGTPYPFIQYQVNEPFRNISPRLFTLVIDVWDRNNSSQQAEKVTAEVDKLIEELSYQNNCLQVKVKRQSINKLEDEDAEIKRRQLTYQLRVFKIC